MHAEVEEFKLACRQLSADRRICTGEPMDDSVIESWPGQVLSDAEFDVLVSATYKLWREKWKLDLGFLFGLRQADHPARDFHVLIYDLRTAQEHADNSEAISRREEWLRDACAGQAPVTEDDWAACGRALMARLNVAIRCLCKITADGRSQASFRQAWRTKVGESVEAAVTRVVSDLGMRLNPSQLAYHVREVERRWSRYRLRNGEIAADVLASLSERSLVSVVDALPCDYLVILDELRVLGAFDAVAALRLAHAVAEISRTTGDTYVKLVESTWATLRSGARAGSSSGQN